MYISQLEEFCMNCNVLLPDDSIFKQKDNKYNKVILERLINEFNVKNADFRWRGGRNTGLGDIYEGSDNVHKYRPYDTGANEWPNKQRVNLFSDEGGESSEKGNLINMIRNEESLGKQYAWFVLQNGKGLTKAGLGRLNRSVEAFVYCILGAQVNVRSSILGGGGSAQETQQEMLNLFESAIIEENISESVQRYQLAVQESNLRLNMVISPSIWLMPSNLIINLNFSEGI